MSCERITQIDAAAYLTDPGAPQWSEFRAHFPSCPDCSSAVASWSRLERTIRGGDAAVGEHPSTQLLERLERDPGSLDADVRPRLEAHLASCRSCSDERAATREFDFAALPPPRERAIGPLRRLAQDALGRVRELGGLVREESTHIADRLLPVPEPDLVLASRTSGFDAQSAGHPVAALREGTDPARVYPLFEGESRLGRSLECEVVLPSDALARVEARITASAGRLEITRLNPRGTLRVNGRVVDRSSLSSGDSVELDDVQLVVAEP